MQLMPLSACLHALAAMPGETVSLDCSLPNLTTLSKPMIKVRCGANEEMPGDC